MPQAERGITKQQKINSSERAAASFLLPGLEQMTSFNAPLYFSFLDYLRNPSARGDELFNRSLSIILRKRDTCLLFREIREQAEKIEGLRNADRGEGLRARIDTSSEALKQILSFEGSFKSPAAKAVRGHGKSKSNLLQKEPNILFQIEECVARASLMAAFYDWVSEKGLSEVVNIILSGFVETADFGYVVEQNIAVAKAIDGIIDEGAKLLHQTGCPEFDLTIKNLDGWLEALDRKRRKDLLRPKSERRSEGPRLLSSREKLFRVGLGLAILMTLTNSGKSSNKSAVRPGAIDQNKGSAVGEEYRVSATETGQAAADSTPTPTKTSQEITDPLEQGKWFAAEARREPTSTENIPPTTKPPESSIEKIEDTFRVVEKGDSLSKIAKEVLGNTDYWKMLFLINPHLGNNPNVIEIGKGVFVYQSEMRGRFAEILSVMLKVSGGKATETQLEETAKRLGIPVSTQLEKSDPTLQNQWLLFDNKQELTLEEILKRNYGSSGEKTLALINRLNQMKARLEDICLEILILPPTGWLDFMIENCGPLPVSISIPAVKETNQVSTPTSTPTPAKETPLASTSSHVVKAGENLTLIAKTYGTTVDAIVKENGIKDKNKIFVGQKLRIPQGANTTQEGVSSSKSQDNPKAGTSQAEIPADLQKYLSGDFGSWADIPGELKKGLPSPP